MAYADRFKMANAQLIIIMIISIITTITGTNNGTPPSMSHLLKNGFGNKIEYNTPKNITVVLGHTGSYKSDLIQFIAENEQSNSNRGNPISSSVNFPGLIVDSKTNTAYYDHPEFDSSEVTCKTLEEKLSAQYLLKKIVDYADSIKLIFVISESQTKSGLDSEHIDTLLNHSLKLIKNFKKLKSSIAFVVTRLDNLNDDKQHSVSDENAIIENIAVNLIDTLKKYSIFGSKRKQNFILNMLKKKNGLYTKLGIFNKPQKFTGNVSEDKVSRDNKKSLEMVINVNTKFTKRDKNNFHYSVSSDIKKLDRESVLNCYMKMGDDMEFGISNNMKEIGQNIISYYENPPSADIKTIETIHVKINSDIEFLRTLNIKTRIQDLIPGLKKLAVDIPQKNIASINNYIEYANFVITLTEKAENRYMLYHHTTSSRLLELIDHLRNSEAWYRYFKEFYDLLSTYEVSKARDSKENDGVMLNDNLQKLRSQAAAYKSSIMNQKVKWDDEDNKNEAIAKEYNDLKQNIITTVSNIYKIAHYMNANQWRLIKASISQGKMRLLASMLDSLFFLSPDPTKATCEDGKFNIQGQFVKLSDVSKLKVPTCKEQRVKEIRLFASNRVFIDCDYSDIGTEIQFSIIAPTWEVVGKRKIILDGKPGQNADNETALFTDSRPGSRGIDGKPGKPGGPAGNFLGIGKHFFDDGYLLEISARGGRGGQGQNGTNGVDGGDQVLPSHSARMKNRYLVADFYKICHFKESTSYETRYYCSDAAPTCKNGGNGGRGGAGGMGGKAGKIKIIKWPGFLTDIKRSATDGEDGFNGNPGIGGKGGKNEILTFDVIKPKPGLFRPELHNSGDIVINEKISYNTCAQGISNTTWFNRKDIEPAESSGAPMSPSAINDYKKYLRELIVLAKTKDETKFRDRSLREFLALIETKEDLMPLYSAIDFVNDLNSLESQFYQLHKELSFLPFYEALLDRITKYATAVYKDKNPNEYDDERIAMRYLYVATLSKIISIRDNKSNDLILQIESYIDSVLDNIEELKNFRKIEIMDNVQKDYHESINDDIERAKDSVLRIKNKINSYFGKIDEDIKWLIDDATSHQKKVEKQIDNLEEMKNAITIRSLLAIPKMAAQFLHFAGPVGSAVGAAITGSSMVVESLSGSDVSKDNIKAIDLPQAFSSEMWEIEQSYIDEQKIVLKQLEVIEEEFRNTTEQAPSIIPPSVLQVQNNISIIAKDVKEDKSGISPDKISKTIDTVKELLGKGASVLADKKDYDPAIKRWSESMDRAVTLFSIVQAGAKVYEHIAGDREKIDLVARAIKESNEQLKKLDTYKHNIYKYTFPHCRILQKNLVELGENINRKNSLEILDVGKWEMQTMLREFKYSMSNITRGFAVQEDINHLMDDLSFALSTMIDVYDRIQDRRDKKILADYIRNINPSDDSVLEMIKNDTLRTAIHGLKAIIQSNVVLEEYERAIYGVKQTVYPLAQKLLDRYQLPFESGSSNDKVTLTNDAAVQLEKLKSEIKNPGSIPQKKHWYNYVNHNFVVKDKIPGPFYVWKYAENKLVISRLLRGEQVTLYSDIRKSSRKISAVKFRKIMINFKFANKTAEEDFYSTELIPFVLEMVHLGSSHYRCVDKFHVITNDEQRFTHQYSSSRGNEVADLVGGNNALLSPYTLWKVKLIDHNNYGFDSLATYENMTIDLALEGEGSYHNNSDPEIIKICNDENLSKYYNEDETVLGITPAELYKREILHEIPGLESHTVEQENHSRKRRSLKDREFERDLLKKTDPQLVGPVSI
ncbi:hypothetical protein TSAR_012667 [Trichomalopsis sarcophagae]|uniref:Uncharacterized protein n=1 Tax=Trichomalopsis sarcophagae TaxID=543379 RepID=A0A232EUJ2_9HYME|nr:hypothetical protein TSAR_012667 [Trichomalopsis sarcophagae]